MNRSCRICLFKTEPTNCVNIFKESRNNKLIVNMLTNLAPIAVSEDDNFPKTICLSCLEKLCSSYDFKNLILASDQQLQNQEKEIQIVQNQRLELKEVEAQFIKSEERDNFINIEPPHYDSVKQEITQVLQRQGNSPEKKRKRRPPNKTQIYRCTICKARFNNTYQVAVHKKTHTGKFQHHCEICKKEFPTNYALGVHRRIHFDARPFKCEICEKTFKFPTSLFIHKKVHDENKPYQCKTCGKTFKYLGTLKMHEQSHIREKPYICEYCSKSFNQISYLAKHLRVHKEDRKVPCPKCGNNFVSLSTHLKTHAEIKIKKHTCQVCTKKFTSKKTLEVHMRIHNGVKPYVCEKCDKKFTQSSCLVRHMRTHTGETPYPCKYCDRQFSYTHHRLKHMKREHPEDVS